MKIEDIDFGFVEKIENPVIEKIVCRYNGTCTVFFYDKPSRELNVGCDAFNRQYGIPVSEDGTKLFVGSWEKGLYAYDVGSGEMLWKYKPGKIRNIFVYSNYLIVSRAYAAVVKIDIDTGEMLGTINSGTLDHIFDLGYPYVFADTMSGKYSIIDVEKMVISKKYLPKIINPLQCLGITITDAALEGKTVTVSGFEQYPQKSFDPKGLLGKNFSRIVDEDFNGQRG